MLFFRKILWRTKWMIPKAFETFLLFKSRECLETNYCYIICEYYLGIWFDSFIQINLYEPPVDTGRKINVHKTFNLRPVSTGTVFCSVPLFGKIVFREPCKTFVIGLIAKIGSSEIILSLQICVRVDPFSTHVKFSEKSFRTPWYAHVRSFRGIFPGLHLCFMEINLPKLIWWAIFLTK